ncbi:hypothetical protein L3X38_040692 [Prunus dulcis]|uniref:Uncharacterized protein n=1 Tax=Prunus dulcis TaxID=3755 RepID=A0AAD4V9H7_PRUDU|nr:hypothetical protein L3X38_040692 [Prunus dulcis]
MPELCGVRICIQVSPEFCEDMRSRADRLSAEFCDDVTYMGLSMLTDLCLGIIGCAVFFSFCITNRSVTYPKGIIEDVLINVKKFVFPVDFFVLDVEEDHDTSHSC